MKRKSVIITVRQWVVPVILVCAALACDARAEAPTFTLEPIVRGLQRPVDLTHDGTDRLFIVEQPGYVRLYENGQLRRPAYLDISDVVYDSGECGLLGIAFHPDFAKNGYFYVNYTTRKPRLRTIIAEFHADPGAVKVDRATERVILSIDQPYGNHNGGQIRFGPDGYLYIGMGDGGSGGDPQNHAQNPASLLGKMLRIDVNDRDPYGVPEDNPFVEDNRYAPEIWATGLRNPWRFSFDRETRLMYAGDVGQNKWEEIDIITRGGNYGWRYFEGTHDHRRGKNEPETIPPIKEYGRELGISVTGGFVYRGKEVPALVGWYLYADFQSGRIWGLKYEDGRVVDETQFMKRNIQVSSFGEGREGELYVIDHGGEVFRITR